MELIAKKITGSKLDLEEYWILKEDKHPTEKLSTFLVFIYPGKFKRALGLFQQLPAAASFGELCH